MDDLTAAPSSGVLAPNFPALSVVVRSKDEGPRLRLALAALARQTVPVEVVVVDDGSADDTPQVVAEAARVMPLISLRHPEALGRTAASNAGAAVASGQVLLFLDGDVLCPPDLAERHLAIHASDGDRLVRGESWHLRQTRLFHDPETLVPMPGEEARAAALSAAERERHRVTRQQVEEDFAGIAARGQPGVYPGVGPRRLQEIEMAALKSHRSCEVLWVAALGHNLSVGKAAFEAVGGFHPRITINEQRLLALDLRRAGVDIALAEGARSYHLNHRRGWRDPLKEEMEWLDIFYGAHPLAAVALLPVYWGSLADTPIVPPEARITSLPALEQAARRLEGVVGVEAVRAAHLRACAAAAA